MVIKKWRAVLCGLVAFVSGLGTGLVVMRQSSVPANPALALTIVPTSLSPENIQKGKRFAMAVSFTNTSNRTLDFVANGPTCFQFIDLKVLDESGKNHAAVKAGNFYVLTVDERQITVPPGETEAGTLSLSLIVDWPLASGTYSAQAFFDYKELHLSSNVVRFRVIDDDAGGS